MANIDEATLIRCLKRAFAFKNVEGLKKMSSWRLCAKSFVFFVSANFILSLPAVGVLKKLCPSSHVALEILCLMLYTSCAISAMFFVLFFAGFVSAVVLFVLRKRYRFIEVANIFIFSCSHALLYPGSVLLVLSVFDFDALGEFERCPRVFVCIRVIAYLSFSTATVLFVSFLFFIIFIVDLVFCIRDLRRFA